MELILGNCLDHLDKFQQCTAIISDPPYGCATNCDYTRFTGGVHQERNHHLGIKGDDKPFDPTPWLGFPKVVLFGFQYFAQQLPIGSTIVWIKKRPGTYGKFLSDAELAWCKGGTGVWCFDHLWSGFDRASERGRKSLHPTQKPVALMRWIIERLKLPAGSIIGDPYMGSGSVGVAVCQLRNEGRDIGFVGCEIEPAYFDIARERIPEDK